jgi:hypothetical protein
VFGGNGLIVKRVWCLVGMALLDHSHQTPHPLYYQAIPTKYHTLFLIRPFPPNTTPSFLLDHSHQTPHPLSYQAIPTKHHTLFLIRPFPPNTTPLEGDSLLLLYFTISLHQKFDLIIKRVWCLVGMT